VPPLLWGPLFICHVYYRVILELRVFPLFVCSGFRFCFWLAAQIRCAQSIKRRAACIAIRSTSVFTVFSVLFKHPPPSPFLLLLSSHCLRCFRSREVRLHLSAFLLLP
jgi:hypothetical protein